MQCMDKDITAAPVAKAHVHGFYRGEGVQLASLVAVVDCTNTDVMTEEGYLHGSALVRALQAFLLVKRNAGMHNYPLCDDYVVTYVSANGMPLRRDRWVGIDPDGYPAQNTPAWSLAKVTATRAYRQAETLAGMSHVIEV